MGYRNLTTQTMVNITGPWLDPEQDRRLFTSLPLLAALLPLVEEAHEGLKITQRRDATQEQQSKVLLEKAVRLDGIHDRKIRGTWYFLGALAEMTDDADLAAAVLDLRERLIPAGLKATGRTYGDQAGDAKLLPARLDDASRRLLKKLKTPDGTLADVVDAWIAAALELEKVDAQRARLVLAAKSGADGVTSRDVVNARNAWIRAVRAVESNLALEKAATDEIVERLLGRLHREEAKADRRGRRADARGEDAVPPADGASPGADTPPGAEPPDSGGAETSDDE